MAAKTQLKDRVTGEELYPVITKDCIPGTEIITTDNVTVIPNDEYDTEIETRTDIVIGKFDENSSNANKLGTTIKIVSYDTPVEYDYSDKENKSSIDIIKNTWGYTIKVGITDINETSKNYKNSVNLATADYVHYVLESIPQANSTTDGLMSKESYNNIDKLWLKVDEHQPSYPNITIENKGKIFNKTTQSSEENISENDFNVIDTNIAKLSAIIKSYMGVCQVALATITITFMQKGNIVKTSKQEYNILNPIDITELLPNKLGKYIMVINVGIKDIVYDYNPNALIENDANYAINLVNSTSSGTN